MRRNAHRLGVVAAIVVTLVLVHASVFVDATRQVFAENEDGEATVVLHVDDENLEDLEFVPTHTHATASATNSDAQDQARSMKLPRAINSTEPVLVIDVAKADGHLFNLTEIATHDVPVIVRNSFVGEWRATEHWNSPEYLAEAILSVDPDAKVNIRHATVDPYRRQRTFFHTPLLKTEDAYVRDEIRIYEALCPNIVRMGVRNFFVALAEAKKNEKERFGYTGRLDEWGALVDDVEPLDPLFVDRQGASANSSTHTVMFELTPMQSIFPAHFNVYHEARVQVHGASRVLLQPPSDWSQMQLHSVLHPGMRTSQIDWETPEWERTIHGEDFEGFNNVVEALLAPGDVLFIPAFWLHHITTITNSVSLSVWSEYEATRELRQRMSELLAPVGDKWEPKLKAGAVRVFLDSLITVISLPVDAAQFVRVSLLENRYWWMFRDETPESLREEFCTDARAHEIVTETPEIVARIRNVLTDAARLFIHIERTAGAARRDILLADYFEFCVNDALGIDNVYQFLVDFMRC